MLKFKDRWITPCPNEFNNWWKNIYLDKPKEIYRQCFEEGYIKAMKKASLIIVGISCIAIIGYIL